MQGDGHNTEVTSIILHSKHHDQSQNSKSTTCSRPGTSQDESHVAFPQARTSRQLSNNAGFDADNDNDRAEAFPEGGLQAWLVVAGSFCAMFMIFGIVNSTAAFQDYLSTHELVNYSLAQVGWIFSVNLFFVFFAGIYVGRAFDAYGPRILVAVGSVGLVASMIALGFCSEYYQFFLTYSVLGGTSGALLNSPAYACIGHYFERRRGLATGVAVTAGSIGGVVMPVMLQSLLPKLGFAWSCRILGFLLLAFAIPANLFLRARLPPADEKVSLLPDFTILKDAPMALCTAGIFFMEWGLFVPVAYISSYASAHFPSKPGLGFTILALLNAGSFFGRWFPGFLADKLGRFNVIIATILLCALTELCIWLPAGNSEACLMVFAITFGFANGSNLSLIPVCLGQLCRVENYGKCFGTAFFVASFGTLTSIPIAGQLVSAANGAYWGLIVFAGVSYVAALCCYVAARVLAVGYRPTIKF